jgi:hypothetical protein
VSSKTALKLAHERDAAGAVSASLAANREFRGRIRGGFKRSSQHDLCRLIGETGQAPLRVSSNQASFGAAS